MCTAEDCAEDMAIRNEDWKSINERIDDAIAKAIKPPQGWDKAVRLLREWSILAANITVIVTLLGMTIGAMVQSFWHIKEETQFRTHTEDRLINIEASLLELRAVRSPAKVLNDLGTVDPKTFAKALPALRKVAEEPASEVSRNSGVLRSIAIRLLQVDESAPEYWPTVLQFLNFANSGAADLPPHGPPNLTIADIINLPTIEGRIVLIKHGELTNAQFIRCRIIFTEAPVHMVNVRFVNCVFEVPIVENPNPYLKKVSRELLASNFTSISSL